MNIEIKHKNAPEFDYPFHHFEPLNSNKLGLDQMKEFIALNWEELKFCDTDRYYTDYLWLSLIFYPQLFPF